MWRIAVRPSTALRLHGAAARVARPCSGAVGAACASAASSCASAPRAAAAAAAAYRCLHSHARLHSSSHAEAAHAPTPSGPASPSASALSSLGLTSPFLTERLRRLGIAVPTEIQAMAVPELVRGSSVLLGAETGSGKTLTYLLPALDWLLQRPVAESQRKYPRVVVLQPNRELCAQLEAVIATIIGPSGQRDLPVTEASDADVAASGTTRLHYTSLVGTQLFPPPGMSVCDILICTPSCLQHNLPPVELARLRARAIKQARADAEMAAIAAGPAAAAAAAVGVSPDPSTPVLLTPTSSPGFNPRGFDPLAFVAAQRIIVLDEADFLLEGGDAHRVRQLLEQTWLKFEPPPGLERASTQGRRNRWRREGRGGRGDDEDARAEAEAEDEFNASLASQRAPPPHGRARQYVFVGATLANISPLTTVQYLLNTFTPRWAQPPLAQSGPVSLLEGHVAQGCLLKLKLSSGFHHLSPGLGKEGAVQWERVGSLTKRGLAPGEWDPATGIDESRLASMDAGALALAADGRQMSPREMEEEDARYAAAEAMALRARGAQKVLKKSAGKKGKNSFGAMHPLQSQQQQDGSGAASGASSKNSPPPPRFDDETDLEKVAATVRFLNAHTPSPTAAAASSQLHPRKSLLFVEKNARLATLEQHLRSLQHAGGSSSGTALNPHVQLIPYHAGLKTEERALAMAVFNSRAPGGLHVPGAAAGTAPAMAANPAARKKEPVLVPVTHQVLLCTSLAARGLDFNQIAPAAPMRDVASTASGPKSKSRAAGGAAVSTAADQIPGFESLVQFDLATNVVDYIHRCGRMFRHRPAVQAPAPAEVQAGVERDDAGVEGATQPPAAAVAAPAAAEVDASAASADAPVAKVLNLYTAQDELLVSHLRDSKGAVTPTAEGTAVTTDAHAEPFAPAAAAPGSMLISDAAFSRKRRLRNKARKAERAAAEAAEAEEIDLEEK